MPAAQTIQASQLKGKVKFARGNAEFFATLRNRVNSYFKENNISKHANSTMIIKSIVMISSYIGSLALLVALTPSFPIALLLWIVMGFMKAGIGMSVMHDANHGAYSSNKQVNQMMGRTLWLLGGAIYNWKLQHNVLHHTYTNITDMDDDIDAKLILRLSPHNVLKDFHRLQYVYAFMLYCITTLYWVLAKDFVQFVKYTKNGVNPKNSKENKVLLVKILMIKLGYLGAFVALPIYAGIPVWQVILGFLLMHAISGFVLTLIFQLAHTVEETTHPLPNEEGVIENNWAIHQMNTTVNFSRNNKLLSWYIGGLNFQVEHHLFTTICHVHYPQLSKIVKKTADEFGIPYLENKTFGKAVNSHLQLLKKYGQIDLNDIG